MALDGMAVQAHLMTEVQGSDKLLEEPPRLVFRQRSTPVGRLMPATDSRTGDLMCS